MWSHLRDTEREYFLWWWLVISSLINTSLSLPMEVHAWLKWGEKDSCVHIVHCFFLNLCSHFDDYTSYFYLSTCCCSRSAFTWVVFVDSTHLCELCGTSRHSFWETKAFMCTYCVFLSKYVFFFFFEMSAIITTWGFWALNLLLSSKWVSLNI